MSLQSEHSHICSVAYSSNQCKICAVSLSLAFCGFITSVHTGSLSFPHSQLLHSGNLIFYILGIHGLILQFHLFIHEKLLPIQVEMSNFSSFSIPCVEAFPASLLIMEAWLLRIRRKPLGLVFCRWFYSD